MFLVLPLVKAPQFALAVALGIGSSTGTKLKSEENVGPLPPLYLLQDGTSFLHDIKERQNKAVKDYGTEVESRIWDNASAVVMGGGFISERHGIVFESLRKRVNRRFKTNVLNSFIRYMNFTHGN